MEWVASEGIRKYEHQQAGGLVRHTDYFGGAMNRERGQREPGVPKVVADQPVAFVTRRPPGNVIEPHFHELSQFQLFVEGHGRIGKHAVQPVTVHYADAFTPYGPIVASEDDGLAFMTLRAQTSNGGAFRMPKSRTQMERRAGRALTAELDPDAPITGSLFGPESDGVEAKLVAMAPQAVAAANDHVGQDRFLVVMSGALAGDTGPLGKYSCTFLNSGEPTPSLTAGPNGANVLLLAFPRPI
jgi:hypothetical protein